MRTSFIASDKTGKEIGLEWRKGIIDAEIKYGEAIEKVHAVPMKDVFSWKIKNIYHDFLSITKKGKTGSANVKKLTKEGIGDEGRFTKNGNTLITSDGTRVVFDGKRKYQGVEINIGERVDAVQSTVQEVGSLSNVDIGDVYVGHLEGKNRNATRGFTAKVGAGNFIGIGFMHDARTLGFHETGHLIEDTTNLAKTSVDYIASRKIRQNTQNIDNSDVAITDFLDQYTGKIYDGSKKDRATEVVSMGVQGLAHFQNLHRAVRDDIDHLRYTLFALEKTIGV